MFTSAAEVSSDQMGKNTVTLFVTSNIVLQWWAEFRHTGLISNLGPSKRKSIYSFAEDIVVTCTETESVVKSLQAVLYLVCTDL